MEGCYGYKCNVERSAGICYGPQLVRVTGLRPRKPPWMGEIEELTTSLLLLYPPFKRSCYSYSNFQNFIYICCFSLIRCFFTWSLPLYIALPIFLVQHTHNLFVEPRRIMMVLYTYSCKFAVSWHAKCLSVNTLIRSHERFGTNVSTMSRIFMAEYIGFRPVFAPRP